MSRQKNPSIAAKIESATSDPGVYLFSDKHGGLLYIGKADNLKNRLKSYLKPTNTRIEVMLNDATKLSWKRTANSIEALILESRLIKSHRPKYNIAMRDDKRYFFVTFSQDDFPRIKITHQPQSSSNAYGPYTDGVALKGALRKFRTLFPYCTCYRSHKVKCLNAHLDLCVGTCCLVDSRPDKSIIKLYKHNIHAIKDMLSGKKLGVISRLKKEMRHDASLGRLESALATKKMIARIEHVFKNAKTIYRTQDIAQNTPRRIEGYDIAHIQGKYVFGSMVVFINGKKDSSQYRIFRIHSIAGGDTAMLKEMIIRRMRHKEWPMPDLVLVDGGIAQVRSVESVTQRSIRIVGIVKDSHHRPSHIYPPKSQLNDIQKLLFSVDSEAHRFAISHYRHSHRKSLLL